MNAPDYYTGKGRAYPSCPKCGSPDTAVRLLATMRGYACLSCNHKWNKEDDAQTDRPEPVTPELP
jgi:transposase-like protein